MSEKRAQSTGRPGLAKRPWVVWSAVCPTIVAPRGGGEAFGWSTGFASREAAEARARAMVSRYRRPSKLRQPEQRIVATHVRHDITRERGAGYVSSLLDPSWREALLGGLAGPWEAVSPPDASEGLQTTAAIE